MDVLVTLMGQFALLVAGFTVFACSVCAAMVAGAKNRSEMMWFFIGLIFGPFGLLAAVGVPSIGSRSERLARLGRNSNLKICPCCAEAVREEAVICRYCHTDLRVA